MTPTPSTQRAGETDVGWIARLLADASADYAWTRWTVSPEEHALRLRALYRLYVTEVALPYGEVWGDAQRRGAAAWTRSDAAGLADAQVRIGPEVAELAGDRVHRAITAEHALAPHRPSTPHWFLNAIGVAPAARRVGVGSALMAPRLAACDAEDEPAALETSTEGTVAFYERLGFAVASVVDVPEHGPTVWLMWRPPSAGR